MAQSRCTGTWSPHRMWRASNSPAHLNEDDYESLQTWLACFVGDRYVDEWLRQNMAIMAVHTATAANRIAARARPHKPMPHRKRCERQAQRQLRRTQQRCARRRGGHAAVAARTQPLALEAHACLRQRRTHLTRDMRLLMFRGVRARVIGV